MPSLTSDVLPTRFGNAIKAFEIYPRDIYGADGVAIWIRLVSVIPKPFLEEIQSLRTQVDFLINCCFFSAIIAVLGLARVIFSGNWRSADLHTFDGAYQLLSGVEEAWIFWTGGGIVAAYLFYRWAVACVPGWGELVMSAFDCYLPTLAGQLGFELPATEDMRRQFWTTFSQQLIYRRKPDGKLPFHIESWKPVPSENMSKEAAGRSESLCAAAEKNGNADDLDDAQN
jgi:hypothetical protein